MPAERRLGLPDLGLGLGLRSTHFQEILRTQPAIDWFELISENYLDCHGWRRHVLRRVAERYPVVMHGVSLSIGSTDPLDIGYLGQLRALAREIGARWISDHLCWTGVAGQTTHDLLPMPLNEASLAHVVARIRVAQDVLGQRLILENPSSYARFATDTMAEADFLREMAEAADCGILLDVNNVYVSAFNHGFDPYRYIDTVPAERVVQIHLAGHTHCDTHILDTHDAPVSDPVWRLYRYAVGRIGPVSTLLEWDADIPALDSLHAEARKAHAWLAQPPDTTDAPLTSGQPVPRTLADATSAYPLLAGTAFAA